MLATCKTLMIEMILVFLALVGAGDFHRANLKIDKKIKRSIKEQWIINCSALAIVLISKTKQN